MFYNVEITEIYCKIDDFLKDFNKTLEKSTIGNKPERKPIMSDSETMAIMIFVTTQVV